MAYVTLNQNNEVTGIFACPQPQLPNFTEIEDSDPRIDVFESQVLTEQPQP